MTKHTQGELEILDASEQDGELSMTLQIKYTGVAVATVLGKEEYPCIDDDTPDLESIAGELLANAQFIVKAWNSHPFLVKALDVMTQQYIRIMSKRLRIPEDWNPDEDELVAYCKNLIKDNQ